MQIELNVMYSITLNEGVISEAGKRAVLSFIFAQEPHIDAAWIAANPGKALRYNLPALPDNWVWKWMAAKDESEYVGTFSKRIANYYFKAHGLKCPESFIANIGNLAKSHSNTGDVYHFMFVDEFDWNAGDFGDAGSCYWGGYSEARVMLVENSALAVCFFDENGNGYARAWMFEYKPGQYILWNGYGMAGDATFVIAQIVAQFLSLHPQRIWLSNNNATGGTLYINSGRGYALTATADVVGSYDFRWGEAVTCRDCGCELSEDDSYTDDNGHEYCEHCFYERYDYCERCGHTYNREDIVYAGDRYLCIHCKAA